MDSSVLTAATVTEREIVAITIAWDELLSYIEAVGDEGSLNDEDMPNGKLRWAEVTLRALLDRNGVPVNE